MCGQLQAATARSLITCTDDDDDFYEIFTANRGSVHAGRYNETWMITEADYITFDVMATNDAHIGLMLDPYSGDDIEYEIAIGGYGNQKVSLRKGIGTGDMDSMDVPDILKGDEFQSFWVSWKDGLIMAGFGHMIGEEILVQYSDPDAPMVNAVSFMTGWGTSGRWKVKRAASKWQTAKLSSMVIIVKHQQVCG